MTVVPGVREASSSAARPSGSRKAEAMAIALAAFKPAHGQPSDA